MKSIQARYALFLMVLIADLIVTSDGFALSPEELYYRDGVIKTSNVIWMGDRSSGRSGLPSATYLTGIPREMYVRTSVSGELPERWDVHAFLTAVLESQGIKVIELDQGMIEPRQMLRLDIVSKPSGKRHAISFVCAYSLPVYSVDAYRWEAPRWIEQNTALRLGEKESVGLSNWANKPTPNIQLLQVWQNTALLDFE